MQGSGGGNPRAEAPFSIRSIVSSHREREGSGKSKSPLPGGLPPHRPAIGTGMDNHAGMTVHYFSSRDAPPSRPRISRTIVCRGPGVQPPAEATFAVRSLVSSHRDHEGSGKSKSPLPGGLPPPGPPADCDRGGDGQSTPACPSIIFHRPMLCPSRPRMSGTILARESGGKNTRRGVGVA